MLVVSVFTDIKNMVKSLLKRKKFLSSGNGKRQNDPLKSLVKDIHPEKMKYKIINITKVGEDTYLYRFINPLGGLPPFKCGQYVSFEFEVGNTITTRAYSICSAPNKALGENPYFEIAVKNVNDGFISKYMINNLKVGDELFATLPHGQFFYNSIIDSKDLLFIAGGSGITPFYSFIQEVNDGFLDVNITLLYGSRTSKDIVLKDELDQIDNPKIKVVYVLSEEGNPNYEKGFINKELIKKYSKEDSTYFICGPTGMYKFVKQELNELGIEKRRIHFDIFSNSKNLLTYIDYPKEFIDKEFNIKVHQGLNVFDIKGLAKESIATSLERNHIKIQTKCRSGICGFCLIQLLKGNVYIIKDNDYRREVEKEFNFLHSCSSYPLSDIEIEIPIR